MKTIHVLIFCCLLHCDPGKAGTFDDHPFFKAVAGKWIGKGELVAQDGTTIKVREVWEGKANDDGTFSISGERESGEDKKTYKWTYSYNPSTELYECEYIHTGMKESIRLDVSVSDNRAVLVAPLGESGAEMVLTSVIAGKTMEGSVVVKDGAGHERLKGKVIHTRGKK